MKVKCDGCGKTFGSKPSRVNKNKMNFHDKRCYMNWMKVNGVNHKEKCMELGGGKSLRRSWSAESIEKALEEVEKTEKKKTRKLVMENEP